MACSRTYHILQLASCLCDLLEETTSWCERMKEKNREQSYFRLAVVQVQCRTFPKRTLSDRSEPSFHFIFHLTTRFRQKKKKFMGSQPDIDGQWEIYRFLIPVL